MSFSYDLATNIGKVRLLLTDDVSTDYAFEDAELQAFLDLKEADVWEAAALACETQARMQLKVSAELRGSDGTAARRRTIQEWRDLANDIRQAALKGTLKTGEITSSAPDEHLDSYRPEWQDLNGVPVVE